MNDMKFEIVVIPVSDVDRAKEFYGRLGWRLDADFAAGDDFRVIQFTPPGSGCSVIFGKNVTAAAPGSAQGLYLIVSDIAATRDELRGRGVEVSELFHSDGVSAGTDEPYLFGRRRISGPDPERGSYRSFASFRDPDGNGWLFQEITTPHEPACVPRDVCLRQRPRRGMRVNGRAAACTARNARPATSQRGRDARHGGTTGEGNARSRRGRHPSHAKRELRDHLWRHDLPRYVAAQVRAARARGLQHQDLDRHCDPAAGSGRPAAPQRSRLEVPT